MSPSHSIPQRTPFDIAIADNPDDITPRLARADWLEEQGGRGESSLAALTRLQIQRAKLSRFDPEYEFLRPAIKDAYYLPKNLLPDGPIEIKPYSYVLTNGALENIWASVGEVLKSPLEEIRAQFSDSPVRGLGLYSPLLRNRVTPERVERAIIKFREALPKVRSVFFDLNISCSDNPGIGILVERGSPAVRDLLAFDLGWQPSQKAFERLAALSPELEDLKFDYQMHGLINRLNPGVLLAMEQGVVFPSVRSLRTDLHHVSDSGFLLLTKMFPWLENFKGILAWNRHTPQHRHLEDVILEHLDLSRNSFADLAALTPQLRTLEIRLLFESDSSIKDLRNFSSDFPNHSLRWLAISNDDDLCITPSQLAKFHVDFPKLDGLVIGNRDYFDSDNWAKTIPSRCNITLMPGALEALSEAGGMPNLRRLTYLNSFKTRYEKPKPHADRIPLADLRAVPRISSKLELLDLEGGFKGSDRSSPLNGEVLPLNHLRSLRVVNHARPRPRNVMAALLEGTVGSEKLEKIWIGGLRLTGRDVQAMARAVTEGARIWITRTCEYTESGKAAMQERGIGEKVKFKPSERSHW